MFFAINSVEWSDMCGDLCVLCNGEIPVSVILNVFLLWVFYDVIFYFLHSLMFIQALYYCSTILFQFIIALRQNLTTRFKFNLINLSETSE